MFVDLLALKRDKFFKKSRDFSKVPSVISFSNCSNRILIFVYQKNCLQLFSMKKFRNKVVRIFLDGRKYFTRVQSFQIHSARNKIQSIVFLVVRFDDRVITRVPVNIIGSNVCKALQEGSKLKQKVFFILISCFFSQIPDFLEVDVSLFQKNKYFLLKDVLFFNTMSLAMTKNLLVSSDNYILKVF